jgi:hypothetical protein
MELQHFPAITTIYIINNKKENIGWLDLDNEVHQYRKGPKFCPYQRGLLIKEGPIKEVLLYHRGSGKKKKNVGVTLNE